MGAELDKKFIGLEFSEEEFPCLIEISKGSKNKYEIDKKTGLLRLDRVLYTSTHYPQNYGYIPLTLADDGDALDCLLVSSEPMLPLSFTYAKPIGVVRMIDSNERDYKILAVPTRDPFFNGYNDVSEIPHHILDEISHFFTVYKSLENKDTFIKSIEGRDFAMQVIRDCKKAYDEEEEKKNK